MSKPNAFAGLQSLVELRQFIEVANSSGFSAAAKTMGQTTATISAAIKRLERTLNTRLFERSTRSVRLTSEGALFYQSCVNALKVLEEGTEQLSAASKGLKGKLVVSAPTDLMHSQLCFWLQDFQEIHKEITIEIRLSDSLSNLVSEPIDLAIRYGFPADSNYIARLLKDSKRIACASPAYIQKYGAPKHPNELLQHQCLCYKVKDKVDNLWRFYKDEQELKVSVNSRFFTDDSSLARSWALADRGIVYKSELDLHPDIKSGRLQPLLTDYLGSDSPLYLVYPSVKNQTTRVKTLIDYLFECVNTL